MRTKRTSRNWPLALVCAALLAGGCGDDESTAPPAPQPGQLTVSVTTTGSAGAAFLLNVRGQGISSPVAVSSSFQLYTFASGDTLKVAVVGTVSSGDLLRFSVPDVNQASSYHVTLEEVAGTDNQLLSTSNFTITINP
jgi:ketol-acid reductoisomerase